MIFGIRTCIIVQQQSLVDFANHSDKQPNSLTQPTTVLADRFVHTSRGYLGPTWTTSRRTNVLTATGYASKVGLERWIGARSRGRSNANESPGASAQTKRSFDSSTRNLTYNIRLLEDFCKPQSRCTTAGSNNVAGVEIMLNTTSNQLQPRFDEQVSTGWSLWIFSHRRNQLF